MKEKKFLENKNNQIRKISFFLCKEKKDSRIYIFIFLGLVAGTVDLFDSPRLDIKYLVPVGGPISRLFIGRRHLHGLDPHLELFVIGPATQAQRIERFGLHFVATTHVKQVEEKLVICRSGQKLARRN